MKIIFVIFSKINFAIGLLNLRKKKKVSLKVTEDLAGFLSQVYFCRFNFAGFIIQIYLFR